MRWLTPKRGWKLLLGILLGLALPGFTYGQPTPAAPANANASADRLPILVRVLGQLEHRGSVRASIRLQGISHGVSIVGGGTYFQQWNRVGEKLMVRTQLQARTENLPVSLLQISNGDRLWTEKKVAGQRTVELVNLARLRNDPEATSAELNQIVPGLAAWMPVRVELAGRQGGLPMLIAGLHENFDFSRPIEFPYSDIRVLGMIGTWKPDRLRALWPQGEGPQGAGEQPAAGSGVPGSVMLLIGQDDLFPYVLEFRAFHPSEGVAQLPRQQFQFQPDALSLIQFYEVQLDVPIDEGQFEYAPQGVEPVDLTTQQLRRMREIRRGVQHTLASPASQRTRH